MKKFEGKTLLELGTSVGSVDIVKYAKRNGATVIVTDYLDEKHSLAKQYADKTYMVSTTDYEGILKICKDKIRKSRLSSIFYWSKIQIQG